MNQTSLPVESLRAEVREVRMGITHPDAPCICLRLSAAWLRCPPEASPPPAIGQMSRDKSESDATEGGVRERNQRVI